YVLAGIIALIMLVWVFLKQEFRGSFDNILGGAVIGGMIVLGWYFTAGSTGQEWLSEIEWAEVRPHAAGAQSFTFVAPSGQLYNYFIAEMRPNLITFALMGALGVFVGSLAWALISRSFRFEWFSSFGDFLRHAIGAVLMGIGGVLAMGCTIGQGVTGVSTLSLGSFMALISIIFGCAITMKIQYYKMIHEQEATFAKSLISALVDFKLLPASMRKLESY
ncbi:MAG: YeeE/YedE family protein, partial [Gammaproteobacteria bacterium]